MALETQTDSIMGGKYNVRHAYLEAPLDKQVLQFKAHGLHNVSPAELGAMRAGMPKGHSFWNYSRTNMDVIGIPRDGKKFILPGGVISGIYIKELVNAHRRGDEFIVPEENADLVYGVIETMLDNGSALKIDPGSRAIPTSAFGSDEISHFVFSDSDLGIRSQDYGDSIERESVTFYFDNEEYVKSQSGLFVNRMRVFGPDYNYDVLGGGIDLDGNDGAFGVELISAEGGRKKPLYNKRELSAAKRAASGVRDGKQGTAKLEKVITLLEKL